MEDKQIVELYWARSETAISETEKKYGRYCHYIAYQILYDNEDAKEVVNDTYLKTRNSRLSLTNYLSVFPTVTAVQILARALRSPTR